MKLLRAHIVDCVWQFCACFPRKFSYGTSLRCHRYKLFCVEPEMVRVWILKIVQEVVWIIAPAVRLSKLKF